MAHNPAAIGNIDGNQVAGGVAYIDATFELHDAEASNVAGIPYTAGASGEGASPPGCRASPPRRS